ncbi:hypothetical protein FNV43_RR03122 [Rhamnella rubrinervis]|uniref:Uncharacterized protein n=1 Tax=Rhamnella rubrinervis TaxID=2594499 RepID=A0A8K0MNR6_9ROSA|nr:hypothetical protein FNV43_RR03122 [Rhamnella rubrinervis]
MAYLRQYSNHGLTWLIFRLLAFDVNSFWIQLIYFGTVSLFGYLALSVSKPRDHDHHPSELDLLFTSVSATTVSSMSTVEMEVLSNIQLIIMTILMLIGGEVFLSMLETQLRRFKLAKLNGTAHHMTTTFPNSGPSHFNDQIIELPTDSPPPPPQSENKNLESSIENQIKFVVVDNVLRYNSIKFLGYVVLFYLLAVHIFGYTLVYMYIILVPTAKQVLKTKAIKIPTFSIFTVVSTFTNCGFIPTNENMIVFKKNSGLLLILIPQILLGNTMYPIFIRLWIWSLWKITKRMEFNYMLRNYGEMGYTHLLSALHSYLLGVAALMFMLVQIILFCSMEWNLEAMDGLSAYQKFIASLFQVANSRHAGESVFDLSTISAAVLVLFVVMMYLPPYTHLCTKVDQKQKSSENTRQKLSIVDCISPLSYLTIFTILICITERPKLKKDPLNFNVLNIFFEVVSAYGNVGFSMGYSCKRQLHAESDCEDKWYGFSGKWTPQGKLVLILVMFFGRLKRFTLQGGKAWKLS